MTKLKRCNFKERDKMLEEKSKYITMNILFETANEGKVGCIVSVCDERAIVKFSHRRVGRMVWASERKLGKEVTYIERINGFVEKYPGKKKEEIVEILKKELEKSGGKITK